MTDNKDDTEIKSFDQKNKILLLPSKGIYRVNKGQQNRLPADEVNQLNSSPSLRHEQSL